MRYTLALVATIVVLTACSSSSDPTGSSSGSSSGTSGSPSTSGGTPDGGGTTGSTRLSCSYPSMFKCASQTFGGSAAAQVGADMCTGGGGTVVNACPSPNLLGCCTQATIKSCVYMGGPVASAAQGEMDCTKANGTWATSP